MAVVGGRMEAVAPRRSLFGPDYLRLAALAAVSAAVHLWLVGHTSVTARDSLGFARYALNLQSPEAVAPGSGRTPVNVIRSEQQPPGYPIAVWAVAKVIRHAAKLPLPESTLLAAQIASAIAALLLVVPTYLLGRMLFGRNVGFAVALLVQVLPVPARITSDGLTEGLYLLVTGSALLLAVRAVRRPGVGGFLLCGLATGASYLVRPEGLMVGAAAGAVAAWLGLRRVWPRDLAAGRLTALCVGVALVAGPYMLLIGGLTKKPTGDHLINIDGNPRGKLWQGQPGTRANPAAGGPLFAEWIAGSADPAHRVTFGLKAVAQETAKGLHYVGAAFALFALVALRRRVAADPGLWVLLVLAGLNVLLLLYLAMRIGYVSERHTVLLVLIGCLFAAAALEPLAAALAAVPKLGRLWAGRYAPAGLLVMLVATAVPSTVKPMHPQREGHKHAGRWLKENAQPGDCVIDPFCWADWYSWRTLYEVPGDPENTVVTYAVTDDKTHPDDHNRLPRLEAVKRIVADGRTVVAYHWPENVPVSEAKVLVYKLVRPELAKPTPEPAK